MFLRDHLLRRLGSASVLTENLLPLYPALKSEDPHWLLVDLAKAVMPELGGRLGQSAMQLLEQRRVDVRLGVSVSEVTATHVTLSDATVLDCSTLIWCAGVTASPLIATLGLPSTKGRLNVDACLRVPGHPSVYAIGDAAAVTDLTRETCHAGLSPLCPTGAQPTATRRPGLALAGRRPDDASMGVPASAALITRAEDADG